MNRTQLIQAVATTADMPQAHAKDAVDATLKVIAETLSRGDEVRLSGFGTFTVKHRDARPGRNLHTGEAVTIAAQNSPRFKASKALKDALN